MKLITFEHKGKTVPGALVNDQDVIPLGDIAADMQSLIELGAPGLEAVEESVANSANQLALSEVTLRAPIPQPRRNIICLGRNYAAHAQESSLANDEVVELPEFPIFFTKATTAVNGPFDDIPYDPSVSTKIDYEAELALIIGRDGRSISREDAMSFVFGYTVMNDISARDLQRRHQQFFIGKSLDGSAPLGPWIVTRDAVEDPQNLRITCTVNDVIKQDSSTRMMIFDIVETIVQLSHNMTLLAGDIIATGTPSGVGFARTPPEFLKPGDVVVSTVEGIGSIRNRIAG